MKTIISATREMVRSIPSPEFTDTWHPIGHATVMDALNLAVRESGMNVVADQYTLVNDGARVFGRWTLDRRTNGIAYSIGFRNSIDKSMAIGICAGTFVMVCANMAFDGEWVEFRMHTGKLDIDELNTIAKSAVASVITKTDEFAAWHKSLKEKVIPFQSERWKSTVFDMFDHGIVPPSRFKRFLDAYRIEGNRPGAPSDSAYIIHAAATNVLKTDNMFTIAKRTSELTVLLDAV